MPANLTVAEVAAAIRASDDSVLRLIRAGSLRATNIGCGTRRARWIIAEADLAEFMDARSTSPNPRKPARSRKRSSPPNYYGGRT